MVYIVGIGPGNKKYMTYEATYIFENCDIILGFQRAMESLDFVKNNKKQVQTLKEVINYINENKNKNVAIAASGDPCYYGITNYIKKNYIGDIKVIAGISSFQYMMSKIGMCWSNAFTGSMHGREEDFIKKVKEYDVSIWLTDNKNTPNMLCNKLLDNDIKCKIYVGENLSYDNEKISSGNISEMISKVYSNLCVVVIEKCIL